MSRLSRLLAVVVVVGLAGSSFAGTYGGGTGTEEYAYQITVGKEKLQFVRRPDLGYVVKSLDENAHVKTVNVLKHSGARDIGRANYCARAYEPRNSVRGKSGSFDRYFFSDLLNR